MKLHVIILQGQIPSYRVPFFNALANDFDVTVIHGGKPTTHIEVGFREVVLETRVVGPFRFLKGLGQLLNTNPAAIVGMFDLRWPQYVSHYGKPRNARFLLWGHRYSRHASINLLRDALLKKADGSILYSGEELQKMLQRGIPEKSIYLAPNSIDVPNHCDTSKQPKSSLLYVGRLQERKRLHSVIEAFAVSQDQIPPHVTFDIVGDGEVKVSLEALARAILPPNRVIFHGAQTDHEILKHHFVRAAAYVSDNVGLGLLHSFAFGVPVMTFRSTSQAKTDFRHGPEMFDFQDGVNGMYCDTQDDLRQGIVRLFSEPEWASSLGQNAYSLFSSKRTLNHMVDGFRSAILGQGSIGTLRSHDHNAK